LRPPQAKTVFCGARILGDIANSASLRHSTSVAGICPAGARLFRDRTANTVNVLRAYWM